MHGCSGKRDKAVTAFTVRDKAVRDRADFFPIASRGQTPWALASVSVRAPVPAHRLATIAAITTAWVRD